MFGIIKGKSVEDCEEHLKLSERIDNLESRIKVIECGDNHEWKKANNPWCKTIPPTVYTECTKCKSSKFFELDEWNDYELGKALDEVERLGGEVTR